MPYVTRPVIEAIVMKLETAFPFTIALAGRLAANDSLSWAADPWDAHGLPVGASAPNFELKDPDGKGHGHS